MKITRAIALSVVLILASCTNSDDRKSDATNACNRYLKDTGYEIVKNAKEIENISIKFAIKENKISDFCFGKNEIKEKYCYLALPKNNSSDGDYTDCPVP